MLAAGGFAVLGLPYVAGCTGRDRGAAVRSGTDEVVHLTSFGIFGRDAYPFVAAQLGFFAESDLSVHVEAGPGAAQDKLAALLAGQAQFAAIDLSGAILARNAGTTGFTTLAAIHQLFPAAIMTVSPDITQPHQLAGRTIAMTTGGIPHLLWPAYAQEHGFEPDQARIVDLDPPQLIPALASGRADGIDQFVMGLPTVQAAVGDRTVNVLAYSDVLTDLYGIALVTTTELAVEQPELCIRFRDALLRGLAHCLDHPEEAGQILADAEESVDPAVAAAELVAMEP